MCAGRACHDARADFSPPRSLKKRRKWRRSRTANARWATLPTSPRSGSGGPVHRKCLRFSDAVELLPVYAAARSVSSSPSPSRQPAEGFHYGGFQGVPCGPAFSGVGGRRGWGKRGRTVGQFLHFLHTLEATRAQFREFRDTWRAHFVNFYAREGRQSDSAEPTEIPGFVPKTALSGPHAGTRPFGRAGGPRTLRAAARGHARLAEAQPRSVVLGHCGRFGRP